MLAKKVDNTQQNVFRGCALYAFDELELHCDSVCFTEEQREMFFRALSWSFQDLTETEALDYFRDNYLGGPS